MPFTIGEDFEDEIHGAHYYPNCNGDITSWFSDIYTTRKTKDKGSDSSVRSKSGRKRIWKTHSGDSAQTDLRLRSCPTLTNTNTTGNVVGDIELTTTQIQYKCPAECEEDG